MRCPPRPGAAARGSGALLLLLFLCSRAPAQPAHPHLIYDQSMLPELREKARAPRFRAMLDYAHANWSKDSMSGNYPWQEWASVLNSNALLFTLEPDRAVRRRYLDQTRHLLGLWGHYAPRLGQGHQGSVDASSVLFNQLLALDVMHPDLSTAEVREWEGLLEAPYAWFAADRLPNGDHFHWKLARLGLLATWHIYHGNTAEARRATDDYVHALTQWSLTPDGSWVQSTGYAHARLGGNRTTKSNALDVIQFNGLYDFYGSQQMVDFWEWFCAFALAPNRHIPRLGETGLFRERPGWVPPLYYLHHYDDRLAARGAWHARAAPDGPTPRWLNNLVSFVLMPPVAPPPAMPTSLLKPNSGAALWGTDSTEALHGILYSLKRENWETGGFHHAMDDVNSLSLSGYGEFLVMNAGTNYTPSYPGETPDGGRWYEAPLQNTVLIGDQQQHALRSEGGGLTDGLTGGPTEFGATSSGRALGGGAVHTRALFLVHPHGDAPGYYAVYDTVGQASCDGRTVHVLWQPNTRRGTETTVAPQREYRLPVNGYRTAESDSSEAATLFFATPPAGVTVTSAWKGSFDLGNFANTKLVADYPATMAGALTLVLPADANHPAPTATRLAGTNYTGARLRFPDGSTHTLLATHGGTATHDSLTTDARAAVLTPRALTVYHATEVRLAGGARFHAARPFSLSLDADLRRGQIRLPGGGDFTYELPGAPRALVDGRPPRHGGKLADTPNVISLPPGMHTIEFTP